jgi:hypothetical protein
MRQVQEQFATRMLRVADELFDDYPQLPMMTVIGVLNETRRELRGPHGEEPSAVQLGRVVRERLNGVSCEPAEARACAS